MSQSIQVKVRMADGDIVSAAVEICSNAGTRLHGLTIKGIDTGQERFDAGDLFEAMTDLRRVLERTGAQLLCAGARVDVYPSGMCRDMGGGRQAYATQIGKPARMEDLVDIFAYAEPESVGTVQQQVEFHAEWIESLAKA